MGYWKIILPSYGINCINNPNAMGNGDYRTIAVATITLDTSQAYFGYRNFKVVGSSDNQGLRLTQQALTNVAHYATVRTYGEITGWDWSMDNTNWYAPTLLGREGPWYIYGYQFASGECSGSTYFRMQKNGAGAFTWYIGHVQVEARLYSSTPINGDRKGFTRDGYVWLGTPNASASLRNGWERSGGVVVDIEDQYKFRVKYGVGTGMPPIQHNVQPLALLPGALYQGHKALPRILDLVSSTKTNVRAEISAARSNFINAIKPDRVYPEQPVVIRYTGINVDKPIDFHGVYDSGMENQITSGAIDNPTPRFICYDPFIYEPHSEGKELQRQALISNCDYVCRKIGGTWSNISTNFNGNVFALAEGKDKCVYLAGAFTTALGLPSTGIVKWDPVTEVLSTMGNIAGGAVQAFCLSVAANGDIYLGGNFTTVNSVANTAYIAKWNGSAWTALATGLSSYVNDIVQGIDGTIYVGGNFLNAGGDGDADYIAKWNGSAFVHVGAAAATNGSIQAMAVAPNGDIYVTGGFTTIGGVSANHIARFDGTTWYPLGTGLSGGGSGWGWGIAIKENGNVYITGDFTSANGVTCNNIAVWNGSTFIPLGTGLNGVGYVVSFDYAGNLYCGGVFTTAGGAALADRMAVWNGTTWNHLDINLPGTPIVYDILLANGKKDLYIGYTTSGNGYASVLTWVNVANEGSHSTYPKIGIHRANDGSGCLIKYIRNETTRHTLRLNYELQKGETLTIDLEQGDKSVVSDHYGPVLRAILRGSDFSKFCMQGGTNYISVHITESGSPTMMCWIEYITTHWAADTAI